jgi:membrane protease YdiL (CAAX protease family)
MFSTQKPLKLPLYAVGVVVLFLAIYAPYFLPIKGVLGYFVIYGIPIVVTAAFFGREILRRAAKNNLEAVKYSLGMFGALTLIDVIVAGAVVAILTYFNPQVPDILLRPNPVLEGLTPQGAWILIGISFLVIGPAEEYLFRGFMYGGMLNLSKGKHWIPLALLASFLFAAAHGYYGTTYEVVSIVPFLSLLTFGFSMCATYYYTGGNILLPALIHGAYDATGFLTVAVNQQTGLYARAALIFVGVAFMLYLALKKLAMKPFPTEETPTPSPVPPSQP